MMRNIVSLPILLFAGLTSALASILPTTVQAQTVTEAWISGIGSDNNTSSNCQRSAPCLTLSAALTVTRSGATIFCSDPDLTDAGVNDNRQNLPVTISTTVTIDCSEGFNAVVGSIFGGEAILINTAGITVTFRNLTIYSTNTNPIGIDITAAAVVRLENCKIFGFATAGVEVAPSSGNVVVKIQDSTITQNNAGILVAPTGSASVSMSIDRSRIENNTGGGMKTVTTNGAINASISDSSVSFNSGNGLNVVSGSGAQNMLSLTRDIIASNGAAGVQANGATSAALIDTTLLDSNTAGATASVGGGRLLTYGTNRIVGSSGSGFTGTASLQ
jgi:hypothetical protein